MKNFGKGMWRRVGDYDKHYGNRNAELQYYLALLEYNRMKEIYNMNRVVELPKEEVVKKEVIKEEVISIEEVVKEEVIKEEVIKEEVIVEEVIVEEVIVEEVIPVVEEVIPVVEEVIPVVEEVIKEEVIVKPVKKGKKKTKK
jgi:hypothetical protein